MQCSKSSSRSSNNVKCMGTFKITLTHKLCLHTYCTIWIGLDWIGGEKAIRLNSSDNIHNLSQISIFDSFSLGFSVSAMAKCLNSVSMDGLLRIDFHEFKIARNQTECYSCKWCQKFVNFNRKQKSNECISFKNFPINYPSWKRYSLKSQRLKWYLIYTNNH